MNAQTSSLKTLYRGFQAAFLSGITTAAPNAAQTEWSDGHSLLTRSVLEGSLKPKLRKHTSALCLLHPRV